MKKNIEHFPHNCNSHNHWKFKLLRAKYGWEGEGKFWAFNGEIGKSDNCYIDMTDKRKMNAIAGELNFTTEQFKSFLNYLIKDCDLVKRNKNLITTEIIQDTFKLVMAGREKSRKRKLGGSPELSESSGELFENSTELIYIVKDSIGNDRIEEYKKKFSDPRYFMNKIPTQLLTSDFILMWIEWIDFLRDEKKKPLTERSFKLQLKILLEETNPVEAIQQSINNRWQGIFKVKQNNGNRQTQHSGTRHSSKEERITTALSSVAETISKAKSNRH